MPPCGAIDDKHHTKIRIVYNCGRGDAGMVSRENLSERARGGGHYIVCMPVHPGGEVTKEVLSRPGRYQTVAENLQLKEVVVGQGERRRRYVVCHNPQEAERQRRHREQMLAELGAEHACADTWCNIRDDLKEIKLA